MGEFFDSEKTYGRSEIVRENAFAAGEATAQQASVDQYMQNRKELESKMFRQNTSG